MAPAAQPPRSFGRRRAHPRLRRHVRRIGRPREGRLRGGAGVVTLLTGRFLPRRAAALGARRLAPPGAAAAARRAGGAAARRRRLRRRGESLLLRARAPRRVARRDAARDLPVLVVAAAVALGRERPDRRRAIALAVAIAGAALVLGGAQIGALSGPGLMFAGSATVAYATYVLLADRFVARVDGMLLAALVTTGAASARSASAPSTGGLDTASLQTGGWLAVVLLAVVCTVVPISSFLLALPRVGPGTASILSTFETVVGVGLAALLLGESLGALQAGRRARGRRGDRAAAGASLGSRPMTLPLSPPLLPQLARSRSSLPDGAGLGLRAQVGRLPRDRLRRRRRGWIRSRATAGRCRATSPS